MEADELVGRPHVGIINVAAELLEEGKGAADLAGSLEEYSALSLEIELIVLLKGGDEG